MMYRLALHSMLKPRTEAAQRHVKLEPTTPSKLTCTKFGMDISMLSPETRQMTLTLQDTPASRDLVAQLCELSEAHVPPGPPYRSDRCAPFKHGNAYVCVSSFWSGHV